FAEPVRNRLSGSDTQESVALQVHRIENNPPAIIDVPAAGIEVVESAGHRVVIACLIDEPTARGIDDDAPRPGSLQTYAAAAWLAFDGVARDLYDRHPPCFAHVAQVCTVRHRHAQPVPGVVRRGDRTMHRAAQKGLRQNRIPFESASAQDDTAASTHTQAPSGQGYPYSGDFSRPGYAEMACSFIYRCVQPGTCLGIEADVGPIGRKRRDLGCPVAQLGEIKGSRAERSASCRLSSGQLWLVIGAAGGD